MRLSDLTLTKKETVWKLNTNPSAKSTSSARFSTKMVYVLARTGSVIAGQKGTKETLTNYIYGRSDQEIPLGLPIQSVRGVATVSVHSTRKIILVFLGVIY